mmetsp:Transcript_50488/g.100471  ORF Transcript_50488/g.100471 Transcript_50488/m.100471 type:complete len:221 (+) Transcript_50488:417-1079(+)
MASWGFFAPGPHPLTAPPLPQVPTPAPAAVPPLAPARLVCNAGMSAGGKPGNCAGRVGAPLLLFPLPSSEPFGCAYTFFGPSSSTLVAFPFLLMAPGGCVAPSKPLLPEEPFSPLGSPFPRPFLPLPLFLPLKLALSFANDFGRDATARLASSAAAFFALKRSSSSCRLRRRSLFASTSRRTSAARCSAGVRTGPPSWPSSSSSSAPGSSSAAEAASRFD